MRAERKRLWSALLLAAVVAGCAPSVAGQPVIAPPSAPPSASTTSPTPTTTAAGSSTRTTTSSPTPTTTKPSTTSAAELRWAHDRQASERAIDLGDYLTSGNRDKFLKSFDPKLGQAMGKWFDNVREIGVEQAAVEVLLGEKDSKQTDTTTKFTRVVAAGVRTPFDADYSVPSLHYTVTFGKKGDGWLITGWKPSYEGDPLLCDCTLDVATSDDTAVITQDQTLQDWPEAIITMSDDADGWLAEQLAGTELHLSKGHLIFLATEPNRWFTELTDPPNQANITAALYTTAGQAQARIVLTMWYSDGMPLDNTRRIRRFLTATVVHEFVHQLMMDNAEPYARHPDPWVAEGIAAAMEVTWFRSDPSNEDNGYYLADDISQVDPDWIADHYREDFPTAAQLYDFDSDEGMNWYALSGSVFLYLADKYGMKDMLATASLLYDDQGRDPFAFFPVAAGKDEYLPAETARKNWQDWVESNYVG